MNRPTMPWAAGAVAVVLLTLASTAVLVGIRHPSGDVLAQAPASCEPTHPSGAVIQVQLDDASGGMMGGGSPAMVRLTASPSSVIGTEFTFVATNEGALNHELVILPAPADGPGTRTVGTDGKIDESSSLGEASRTCGQGTGAGITPGGRSWVTVSLKPGSYELVCDIPWHYANGMFTLIRVTLPTS